MTGLWIRDPLICRRRSRAGCVSRGSASLEPPRGRGLSSNAHFASRRRPLPSPTAFFFLSAPPSRLDRGLVFVFVPGGLNAPRLYCVRRVEGRTRVLVQSTLSSDPSLPNSPGPTGAPPSLSSDDRPSPSLHPRPLPLQLQLPSMPYDPIRDASSSGPTSTTPNGTYQSPSASARALSPSSAGLHPTPRGGYPPAFGSSTGEDVPPRSPLIAGPSSSAGPSMSGPVEGGGSLLSARRPAAPPSKRLSLSMLLNENKQQLTPEHESTPRLGLSPSSADRPPVRPSLQPSPAGSWSSQLSPSVREPSPSTLSTHPHQPTPPGPRRTSLTSEPSRESSQPLPTPAVVAPPGFTDEDATTSKSDTSFVMDAVNPALKRKRDSLVAADGLAGQRRKSSTSSVVSRSSSGRNGSIGGEPDEFRRKSSSAGSSTSSQPPASHPLQSIHPRPSVLAQPYPTDSTPPAPPSAPPPPPSQPPLPSSSAYLPPSHLPPRPPPQSHHSSHHPPPPPPPPNPRLPPPGPAHPSSQPIMQPPPPDPSAPRRTAYAPRNRTSAPRSVLTPISWDEYTQLRDHPELVTKNPMRGKGPRQPKAARVTPAPAPASLPSSVSARPTPSNGGSYFPTNAAASSSSRPPSSSGVGAEGGVGAVGEVEQPGDADDDYVPMSPAAVVPTKRSASGQPEDGDNRRRRVDGSGGFVNADVAKVASHCESDGRTEGGELRSSSPTCC